MSGTSVSRKTWGQLLTAELLGGTSPLNITTGYRRPSPAADEANQSLFQLFQGVQQRHWVLSMDWNMPPGSTALSQVMTTVGGRFVGGSGHQTSRQLIDTVWSSQSLLASKIKDLP